MVLLCAASVLSLNSSLYKFDVWQLKDLGEFHADVVAVRPALVVVSARRWDISEPGLRLSLPSAFHHDHVTLGAFSSQRVLHTQQSRHVPLSFRACEGQLCVCVCVLSRSRSFHLSSNTIRFLILHFTGVILNTFLCSSATFPLHRRRKFPPKSLFFPTLPIQCCLDQHQEP